MFNESKRSCTLRGQYTDNFSEVLNRKFQKKIIIRIINVSYFQGRYKHVNFNELKTISILILLFKTAQSLYAFY